MGGPGGPGRRPRPRDPRPPGAPGSAGPSARDTHVLPPAGVVRSLSHVRIALVSTPFLSVPPRGYGGTELVVHDLEVGLSSAGHEVTLLATGDSRGADVRALYPKASWPPDPAHDQAHSRWAAEIIARERFDVVHAHTPALIGLAGRIEAPVVYTIHHARDERLSALYQRRPTVRYVAISARQAELEPGLRCEVIHHGLDPARYPAGRGQGGYAAFLGRLAPCKAPEVAVWAARRAGLPIRVAGAVHEGDAKPAWEAELRRALRGEGVTHVGPVGGARKAEFLRGARALVVPLRWEEPFGLVLIEAMLCGTPVAASARGSAPEIVDEGVTGFLARREDDLPEALARAATLDRAACRRRALARFGAARMVAEYERVYGAVAAPAAGAAIGARAPAAPEESHYVG